MKLLLWNAFTNNHLPEREVFLKIRYQALKCNADILVIYDVTLPEDQRRKYNEILSYFSNWDYSAAFPYFYDQNVLIFSKKKIIGVEMLKTDILGEPDYNPLNKESNTFFRFKLLGGLTVDFIHDHPERRQQDRITALKWYYLHFNRLDDPTTVLVGNLVENSVAGPVMKHLSGIGFGNVAPVEPTYPSSRPMFNADCVFLWKDMRLIKSELINNAATTHFPILVEFSWG